MTRILLAGESWISHATHYKGFDSFDSVTFHTGADDFVAAAAGADIEVVQLYAHDVPEKFPGTVEELQEWDAVILSDIGANSFLLPQRTWVDGRPSPNRLQAIADYVRGGGGLMMAGGYLSFSGFQARAGFARTPLAEVLPVRVEGTDDRMEIPQGVPPVLALPDHPAGRSLRSEAPALLGYNVVTALEDAEVVATVNGDVLIATRTVGAGRSLVWTSDIGPHWCPQEFLDWDGFGALVPDLLGWVAGA